MKHTKSEEVAFTKWRKLITTNSYRDEASSQQSNRPDSRLARSHSTRKHLYL